MTIERKQETINTTGVIDLPRGNFFLLVSATANVNVRAHRDGHSERFDGIAGGLYVRRVTPWLAMQITGVAGTIVEYFIGTENVEEDTTDIRLAVTAIAGSVSVREAPSDTIVDNAPIVIATGTEEPVAANAARRRLRLAADSLNPGSVYVRSVMGGNNIDELQAGTSKEYNTLQGLFLRNDSGANCTVYVCEEE